MPAEKEEENKPTVPTVTDAAGPSSSRLGDQTLPVLTEEVTIEQVVKKFLEAKEPITLSKFLQLNAVVPEEMLAAFETKSIALASKKRLSKFENDWVKDYIINSPRLRQVDRSSQEGGVSGVASAVSKLQIKERPLPKRPDESGESSDSDYSELDNFETPPERMRKRGLPKIKLNELVLKPEVFDGVKPQPRRWIDDCEKAARANAWTDHLYCQYLPTFLTKSALDWFVTIGENKVVRNPKWA